MAMEDRAKLLADLAAAISSMNTKLDDLHPLVLELNQCRPGVGRAVDALRAEVGDLQARVADTTDPTKPEGGTDMPPLLLLSADAPSSSSKPASASNQTSPAAATSCLEVCTCAPPLDTNGRIAEVPAPTCSETEQDIPFQIAGVTTVALRHKGVPELAAEPTALLCSPSPTKIGKETLDKVLSACTSSITTMPTTCSTVWLPQGPVAALVLVASLPRTMTESIASQHAITKFPVHLPVPWPFFLVVHANGDETRPLPWPSFRISYSRESPRDDAVMELSRRCTSGSSSTSTTFGDVIELQVSSYHGNLCTSTSCFPILHMCSASELRCWHGVHLCLEYLEYVPSVCTLHITLVWSSCPIFGFPMRNIVRSLELKLLSHDSTLVNLPTVLLDSSISLALNCEYLGGDSTDCNGSGLFSGCSVAVCQEYSVHCSSDYCIARETISWVFGTMDWYLLDFPHRSAVTVWLSYLEQLDHYFYSSQLKKLLILNLMRRLDVSFDLFSRANQYPSYCHVSFVTGDQIRDFVACSTQHLFLSGFPPSFRPVVRHELKLAISGSHCVYLQHLQMDRSGIEGGTLNINIINVKHWRLMWYVDMTVYCSSFSCTCACTICESILAPTIFSSAWANLICFFNSEMCALLVGFLILNSARIKSEMSNRNISTYATMPVIAAGISHSITVHSRFDAVGLWYKGFPVVHAPIQTGRVPPSIGAGSYSHKNGLYGRPMDFCSFMIKRVYIVWRIQIAECLKVMLG